MFWSCFCFFKQTTAYEMRISDWSSDVCSSDLLLPGLDPIGDPEHVEGLEARHPETRGRLPRQELQREDPQPDEVAAVDPLEALGDHRADAEEIGRASCRERVCQYV